MSLAQTQAVKERDPLLHNVQCSTQLPPGGVRMPNSVPDDIVIRSVARISVIRASLASRPWPLLADLSQSARDRILDGMAIRGYRAETGRTLVEGT